MEVLGKLSKSFLITHFTIRSKNNGTKIFYCMVMNCFVKRISLQINHHHDNTNNYNRVYIMFSICNSILYIACKMN